MRTHESSLRHDPVSMSDARRAFAAAPVSAFLATGFGSGLSPIAPGTAGSAVGLAIAWLLHLHAGIVGSPVGLLMSGLAVGLLGVAVSVPVCRALAAEDPGCVVIDEVSGQLIACAGAVPFSSPTDVLSLVTLWDGWGLGSGLRALSRSSTWSSRWESTASRRLPDGWGVVADDVLGGLYALVVLIVLAAWAFRMASNPLAGGGLRSRRTRPSPR